MIYGGNRAFRGHAKRLLAWNGRFIGATNPCLITLTNDRYCLQPFQVVLARQVASGRPIPAEMALMDDCIQNSGQKTQRDGVPKNSRSCFQFAISGGLGTA